METTGEGLIYVILCLLIVKRNVGSSTMFFLLLMNCTVVPFPSGSILPALSLYSYLTVPNNII